MPVTAKLSRRFYEQFGDETANELVDWFNAVDATYRTELNEFNELNFGRFDAKVEQRFAESEARFARQLAAVESNFDERFGRLELRFEERFGRIEKGIAELDAKTERRFAEFESKIMRWMFVYWTGTAFGLAGLLLVALRLR